MLIKYDVESISINILVIIQRFINVHCDFVSWKNITEHEQSIVLFTIYLPYRNYYVVYLYIVNFFEKDRTFMCKN